MSEFLDALAEFSFLRYALVSGLLASVAFGIIGTYVVTRRISYLAGAISHSVLGGIGAGVYCQEVHGWTWFDPMLGAVIAALVSALAIGLVSLYAAEREDTVIGAIWAIGMAVGILFFFSPRIPGYVDPMSYLFGNILLLSRGDLWLVAGLDLVVVALAVVFHNKFLAVSFDEEFARLRGIRARAYYLLLLCLTALTVVLLIRVVGIVMVIALLTLPAAVAGQFARRLWQMMVLAVLFSMLFMVAGLGTSYAHDLPTGPTIILIAGVVYLVTAAGGRALRWARALAFGPRR
ncbi:MAG: metal ABC transporter permease [Pirellulales bacterium]|nr:metal ABC transporter permease [Pirellulales bacterium]